MQEDKWSTQLGERLRKLQEEAPQPYIPGAWEAFVARRNQKRSIPLLWWWAGGIAASLALLFFVGSLWTGEQQEQAASQQLALETQVPQEESAALPAQSEVNLETPANGGEAGANFSQQSNEKRSESGRKSFPSTEQGISPLVASKAIPSQEEVRIVESATEAAVQPTIAASSAQVAVSPIASLVEEKAAAPTNSAAPSFTEIIPSEAEALLAAQKEPLAFAVGLGPGFGNSSEANQITSGSRIGLGMQVDMALAGKLRIGSGLGVNYLSQASEGEASLKLVGVNSPIQETTQVQQVQVDLPLYVRFPISPSRAISLQAGFSNLLTFNQTTEQELVFTRQATASDLANSLSTQKTVQVTQSSTLPGPSSRFLPFAQANLGVNVRVYENKKTSYLLMPFYSYPLQDISGTGQNPAVVGAAVKITFGTLKK
ncbi:MAG: hypothetical protein RJA23_713 [Bacteroidota bacterium]|jgi:hypothetical protein